MIGAGLLSRLFFKMEPGDKRKGFMKRFFSFALAFLALIAAPTAQAQYAIPAAKPIASAAVSDGWVVSTKPITVVRLAATSGASAGYFLVLDATAKPSNGAVTPVICRPIAANSSVSLVFTNPARFDNGLVLLFSTTGCYTLTLSATAFFEASPK